MKTPDVTDRMGVYKRLEDVPDDHRLRRMSAKYEGRNVWDEYEQERLDGEAHVGYEITGNAAAEYIERAGRYWREHMDKRGRHHALAQPSDVETYLAGCLEGEYGYSTKKLRGVYLRYYNYVEAFYSWLMWHDDHDHRYHPVWMAIVEYPDGVANDVWSKKMEEREE